MSKEKKKEKSAEPKKAKTKKSITTPAAAPVTPAVLPPETEPRPAVVAEASPKPKARPKRPASPRPAKATPTEIVITVEEISLRAYFISERRRHLGWPGDEHSDWVEAERQLREEKAKPAKKKTVKKI